MNTDTQQPYVGRSVVARDGDAFVAGRARYTADFSFPGQLHACIVRSVHAAAKIRAVDFSAAEKIHGVVRTLAGREAAQQLDPIPHYLDPTVIGGRYTPVRCLALDDVTYEGQPVAVVVATEKRIARYAASKVIVEYEPHSPILDATSALADGARRVISDWDENVVVSAPFVGGDIEQAFDAADHVVSLSVDIHRQSTQPIETRAYNAVWNEQDSAITLYATAQNPHPLRYVLAATLRMPENRLRIIAPAIGGAFGLKMHGHPEEGLICLLCKLTRRPVKWVEDRRECLLIGGREQIHEIELALTDSGRILGLRDRFIANTGAPSACPGWAMAFLTGLTMPGPYDVDNIDVHMTAAVTNKPPWNASRGYGKEATALALELALDKAARALDIDPAAMRLQNFIPADSFPNTRPTGLILDSGDYHATLQKALDLIGYQTLRTQQATDRKQGRYVGIGMAYELTPEGGAIPGTMVAGYDTSTVRLDPSGTVTVLTGVTSPGTGNPVGIAQIVADELGVAYDDIRVLQGDTQTCPYGFGNYSGRSTIVGGGSAALAARKVKEKVVDLAARLLEVAAETVTVRNGVVSSSDKPGTTLTIAEVCYAAYTRAYDIAASVEPPLEASATFRPGLIRHAPDENGNINPYPSYSNAAYACVCEVDIDTGRISLSKFAVVHDCGKVINPVLVEGQACGAIAFGIGGMLGEQIIHDTGGRQLTTDFMDYVMPRALDVPAVAMGHHDSPNPVTMLGLKGAGEAGVGGSAAAIINAVNDALAPFGVEITKLPLSAPRLWHALQAAQRRAAPKKSDKAA